jgi:hypothetical protein
MCTGCYDQVNYYDIDLNENYHSYKVGNCKKCGKNVAVVDDMIIETIILLNKKGYKTRFCCSGHLNNKDMFHTYIMFDSIDSMPDKIPFGFMKTDNHDNHCIRLRNPQKPKGLSGLKRLFSVNEELYRWAEELPVYEVQS